MTINVKEVKSFIGTKIIKKYNILGYYYRLIENGLEPYIINWMVRENINFQNSKQNACKIVEENNYLISKSSLL